MYTAIVAKKQDTPPTELGRFMRKWREDRNLTVDQAADDIGVVKSTWSNLERGKRAASIETLMALSLKTEIPLEQLSRMAGLKVQLSSSIDDRARRVSALAAAIPQIGAVLDLLGELSGSEVDAMLTFGESLVARRNQRTGTE